MGVGLLPLILSYLDEWFGILILIAVVVGLIAGIVCGFIFWVWWAMLLILGALFAVAVPIISHWCVTDPCDFADWFIDGFGWVAILGSLLLACVVDGIICGFVFWNWIAMLAITLSVIVVGSITGISFWVRWYLKNKKEENQYYEFLYNADPNELSVDDLKELCLHKGLISYTKYSKKIKKEDLISMLNSEEREEGSYKPKAKETSNCEKSQQE